MRLHASVCRAPRASPGSTRYLLDSAEITVAGGLGDEKCRTNRISRRVLRVTAALDEIQTVAAGSRERPPSSRRLNVSGRTGGGRQACQPRRHDRGGRATASGGAGAVRACTHAPSADAVKASCGTVSASPTTPTSPTKRTCSRPSGDGRFLIPALDPSPGGPRSQRAGMHRQAALERGILDELEVSADTIGRNPRRARHPRHAGRGLRALLGTRTKPPRATSCCSWMCLA